jgi:hypothetical protein
MCAMNVAPASRKRVTLLVAITAATATVLFFVPPIRQWPSYHHFADQRVYLGIPNFANVISNLPFFRIGLIGMLFASHKRNFVQSSERWPYFIFFLGVTLTCFGSAYYHWNPNDQRLVWDRLPITLAFMAVLDAIIGERLGVRAAKWLLPCLLLLGLASVLFWQRTGDLRPYVFVQFFPIVIIPLLLTLFPARYTRAADFYVMLGFYVAAKLCELFDAFVFRAGGVISGHTLKHLLAAMAAYWLYRMLALREPVARPASATAAATANA